MRKDRKVTLSGLISSDAIERLMVSGTKIGEVYRMHLGDEEMVKGKNKEDDGRNKYFIVIGHDTDGNALGVVLIDSKINPWLPQKRKLMHYSLDASKYSFLNGVNRFADCSDLKVVTGHRFVELFNEQSLKGMIDNEDLSLIQQAVSSYEDAQPKLLKRFGLI